MDTQDLHPEPDLTAEEDPQALASPAGRRGRLHVLIVDDVPEDRALVRRLIERRLPHCRIRECETVAEAVRQARRRPPEVLVLDNTLPDGEAADVLMRLTVARGTCLCPVIVLTGGGHDRLAGQLLKLGAGDSVPKAELLGDADRASRTLERAITHAREQHRLSRRAALYRANTLLKRRRERVALDKAEVARDEARVAQREAEGARERLDLAVEGANLGTWDWYPATGEVHHNDRLLTMLGYEPDELSFTYTLWRQLLHPDDVPQTAEALTEHLEGRRDQYRVEYRLRTKSGQWKWVLLSGKVVLRDEQNRPLRVAGVHLDIDDRKRAELAQLEAKQYAEEAQQQLVDMLTSIRDAFVVIDRDWCYTYVNPRAEQTLRKPASQLVGQRVWDVWPDAEQTPFGTALHRAMESHEAQEVTAYYEPLGIWVEVRAYPAEEGLSLFFLDVTADKEAERRLAEQARQLAQRTAQLDAMLSNAPVGFAFLDRSYRYLQINGLLAEMNGSSIDEHLGRPIREIVPGVADSVEPVVDQVFDSGRPAGQVEVEGEIPSTGGRKRWWLVGYFPVTANEGPESGRVVAVGMVVTEITSRKRAEQALLEAMENAEAARVSAERAKEIAERADRAKSEFLAVLSHELRTPLTPVLAGAQLLEQELQEAAGDGDGLSHDAADTLSMIRRNVELEVRLIDDLLDLTRITRGKLQLSRKRVDLNSSVQHVVEICRNDLDEKRLEVSLDLSARTAGVFADPARLQQILWNLVKNAIKFTPPGGRITIRTYNRPPRASAGDASMPEVACDVTDSGVGIEPEVLPGIFNAFEQGGAQVTRTFGGLGLGLAITRALVVAHHGTITADSEGRGKGATFTVAFPGKPLQGEKPDAAPPPSAASTHARRVLLVEDHADTARLMARFLERRLKVQVTAANNITHAVELFSQADQELGFDLIISDIGLPDGNGTELLRRIQKTGATCPPAIALSGYGTEQDVANSRDAGFSDHLTKPVDLDRLETVVRQVLR